MRLSNKDTLGLALAAFAVVLLVLHGRTPHGARASAALEVEVGTPTRAELVDTDAEVIAFVNVLLPGTPHTASRRGVAIVDHGVVSTVGSADEVDVPNDAAVIDGDGSAYLVATPFPATGSSTWAPVTEGLTADLLLLAEDPRETATSLLVQGRLTRGRWSPDGGAGHARAVPAGH